MDKFDKLYKLIMETITEENTNESDKASVTSILQVFDWDESKKDFSDLKQQITNFQYVKPNDEELNEFIETIDTNDSELGESTYRKIIITDKHANKQLKEFIIRANDLNQVKSLISAKN